MRIAYGSSEVVFDMQDSGVKDPFCKVVQEHWMTFSQCLLRNKPEATRIEKAWEHTWRHLSKAKHPWRRCAGPMGAMVCYLMQLGFTATNLTQWQRQNRVIIKWGDQASLQQVRREIDLALQEIRWEQVAAQAGGSGSSYGLDSTAHHRLLKRHAKRHTICTGLRMAWQGAVLRKDHGRPDSCPRCGKPNTLRHAILECPAWESFDMGVDKSWVEILPKQEDCFILRGLVPRHWTHHPPLTAKQLQPVATGLLLENLPDISGLFVATDASGGPEGKDSRWRVVTWAAVIAQLPDGPFPIDSSITVSGLEVVGTIKGALQVGSSVAEGESRALFEVAHRTVGTVMGCVDNKAAIAQAEDEKLQQKWPHIWGDFTPPNRYQLDWIKSHQTEDEFLSSRPQSERWKWALNDAADKLCGAWASENTDHRFVARAKDIEAAASAYNMFLARRCEHLLTTQTEKAKDVKFRPTGPIAQPKPKQASTTPVSKKQLMLDALAGKGTGGHSWCQTSKMPASGRIKNLTIKCQKCSLFAQQIDGQEDLARILQRPCEGEVPSPLSWKFHSSHRLKNLGNFLVCAECGEFQSVRLSQAKAGLAKVCQGHGHKSNDKVKSLFSSSSKQVQGLPPPLPPKKGTCKKSDGKVQTKLTFK